MCEDQMSNTLKTHVAKLLLCLACISTTENNLFVQKIIDFNVAAIKGVTNLNEQIRIIDTCLLSLSIISS